MGPYLKKTQGGNLFLLLGGWTRCFTILFSYWFSITTINQKKTEVPHQSYFVYLGSFTNRKNGWLSLITMFYQFLPTLFLNVSSHWCFAPGTFGLAIVQPQSQLEVLTVDAGSAFQGIPRDPRVGHRIRCLRSPSLGPWPWEYPLV